MMRSLALAAALLLGALPALAQPAAPSPLPNQNGPFSATMVFVPQATLPDYERPPGQTPFVVVARDARVGDAVGLKILFMGAGPDSEGQIDVTYDIRILGPDGQVHRGIQETGLEAGRSFSPAIGTLLDNRRQVVAMRFEDSDPAGVYRAVAVLHDKVAQRDIPLTAEIELKK